VRGDKFILEKLWVKGKNFFFQEEGLWWRWKKCIYVISGGTWTKHFTSTTKKSI